MLGFMVFIIKCMYYLVDLDFKGIDIYKYCMVGVLEVVLVLDVCYVILKEYCGMLLNLDDLIVCFVLVDLVLIEGFKVESYLKIEVYWVEISQGFIVVNMFFVVVLVIDILVLLDCDIL